MPTVPEVDTRCRHVPPTFDAAGWDDDISEQKTFADGRIIVVRVRYLLSLVLRLA
jgi:hypothetical protein